MHVLATDVVPWTTTLLLPNHDPYHPLLSALSLSSPTDLSETDRRALITLTDHPTVDSTHLLYVIARLRSSFQRHSERSLLAACNEYLTERLVPWDPGFLKDVHPEVCVTAAELNLDVYPFTLRDRLRLARVGTGPVLEERVSNILTEINLRLPSSLIDSETNPNWSNAYPDVSLVEGDDFQLVGPIDSPEAYLLRRVDQHTFKLKESSSNGTTRSH